MRCILLCVYFKGPKFPATAVYLEVDLDRYNGTDQRRSWRIHICYVGRVFFQRVYCFFLFGAAERREQEKCKENRKSGHRFVESDCIL